MGRTDTIELHNGVLKAHISLRGAELLRLSHKIQGNLLWTPDPAYWNGISPILFPTIGRSPGGTIRVDGVEYPCPPHGFARGSDFALSGREPDVCTLVLTENEGTLAAYPFRFRLTLEYRLTGAAITCHATVFNPNARALPASFGFHPAFRWPLPQNVAKSGHKLIFPDDEWLDAHELEDDALAPKSARLPLHGHSLALREDLFSKSAQIVPAYRSKGITYRGEGSGPEIRVTHENLPHLGLWMKPGANYICIEPWHGLIAPIDFAGEVYDRPGGFTLAPGEERRFTMAISVHAPGPHA